MEPATRRSVQSLLPSVIAMGLSLYFAVVFGSSGAKILLWMQFGVTDFATGAIMHSAGSVFSLTDRSLTYVTAGLGAAKLAIAGYFVVAMLEHASVVFRGTRIGDDGSLDLAVFAAIGMTLLYAYPSWIFGETVELRTHLAHAGLLLVAAFANRFQRERRKPRRATRVSHLEETAAPLFSAEEPLPSGVAPRA